jgi:hypothetical protein
MQDKRDAERVAILGELQGEMMVFQPMQIKEISVSGVTVETRFPLHIDSLHDIRLLLGETPVILKGRVIHSRISDVDQDIVTYRTGLEFIEPSEHAIGAVAEYLETVKSNRSGV